jgi:hypothetical protein
MNTQVQAVAKNAVAENAVAVLTHTQPVVVKLCEEPLLQIVYINGFALRNSEHEQLDLQDHPIQVRILGGIVSKMTQTSKFPETMGKRIESDNLSLLLEIVGSDESRWKLLELRVSNTKYKALAATLAVLLATPPTPGLHKNKDLVGKIMEWRLRNSGNLTAPLKLPRISLYFKTAKWMVSNTQGLDVLMLHPAKTELLPAFNAQSTAITVDGVAHSYNELIEVWVQSNARLAEYMNNPKNADPNSSHRYLSGFYYKNDEECVVLNAQDLILTQAVVKSIECSDSAVVSIVVTP